MYIDLHVKYPLFLLDFNESWILTMHRAFRRITLIINQQMHLHKISH